MMWPFDPWKRILDGGALWPDLDFRSRALPSGWSNIQIYKKYVHVHVYTRDYFQFPKSVAEIIYIYHVNNNQ